MTVRAKLIALGAAVAALILLGWYFRETIGLALQGHTKAKLATNQVQAGQQNAGDAVNTVGKVAADAQAHDDLTRENDHAIRSSLGGSAPVDHHVRDAGLLGLCRRAAYRGDPKCLRFTPAGNMADSGAGSHAPGR